jgi:hypothetical protein
VDPVAARPEEAAVAEAAVAEATASEAARTTTVAVERPARCRREKELLT